jgi:hypothetical protein
MIEVPFFGAFYSVIKDVYKWATHKKFPPEQQLAQKRKWKPIFEDWLRTAYLKKYRRDIIIRDVQRIDSYPNAVEKKRGISSWFRLGALDTLHDGVLVAFHWQKLVEVAGETYRVAKPDEHDDPTTIKVVLAAIIPYYLIEEIEIDGDEYYRFPHVYCHFSLKKQPYKSIEFYEERQAEGFPKPYFVQVGEFKKIAKLSRKAGIKHV